MKSKLILPIIIFLATILRVIDLSFLPISLFGDEVDVGYHAWSLATTAKDYAGNFLPTYIKSLSESRAPLLMYVTAPFVGILGPSTFSVRLPSALLGILGVFLTYLVTRKLTKNQSLNIISALILAITPWHIHYSRAAFESTLLLDLILGAVYFYLDKKLAISSILFVLTLYTYSTAMVFTPLLVLGLLLFFPQKEKLSGVLPKLIPAAIILLPLFFQIFFGEASGRFSRISVWSDTKIVDQVVTKRIAPWVGNTKVDSIFINKYTFTFYQFIQNYTQTFNKDFLFVNGDQYFRHSSGMSGEFLLPLLPLFLLGLATLIRRLNQEDKLMLYWLLFSPIPSSLTQSGGNHATRLFIMIPALVYIISLGIEAGAALLKKLPFKIIIISAYTLAIAFSFGIYWYNYSNHYRFESAKFWHYGFEEIFSDTATIYPKAKRVFINNTYEPSLLRFAFYTKLPPKDFQNMFYTDDPSSFKSEYFSGFMFGDKYFFGQVKDQDSLEKLLEPGDVYLAVQGIEVPGDWDWRVSPPSWVRVLSWTTNEKNQPLFYLITKKTN